MVDAEKTQLEFGKRLRELRTSLGMSQEKLGFAANMDRTYVNSVEQGKRNVSLVNIARLAEALSVPVAELFVAASSK